jgi:polyphosphate glucokinase
MKVTSQGAQAAVRYVIGHTDKADSMKINAKPTGAPTREVAQPNLPAFVQTIEIAPTTTDAEQSPADVTRSSQRIPPRTVLVIDVGGTKVKMMATGQTEPIKFPSGRKFPPARLVEMAQKLSKSWDYEAISIGYPGLVGTQGPRSEPGNLAPGWVGFDFAAAFGKPVKMTNDAAMQALGSYEGGRMLFLGLGTGLGSTLITGHMIIPLELGRLIYDNHRTVGQVLGRQGLRELGKAVWRKAVTRVVTAFMHAFVADYVVVGGGNAKNVKELPPGARKGNNLTAFRGGFRLWSVEDVWVLAAPAEHIPEPPPQEPLRMR